jgi:hypothetical protein
MSRASISIISAADYLRRLGRFAGLHSVSVVAHFLSAPCPSHDRPCRVVHPPPGETLRHVREVQRLCCDRYLPCRFRRFSPQGAPTNRNPARSEKSRNGVIGM